MAKVSIAKTGDDLPAALARVLSDIGEPVVARGDFVIIKPNLVRPEPPDSGEITNPGVIEAVARYCLERGAGRVIIGEGPGFYNRESELKACFTRTGVSEVARRLGIEWVLFDDHDYRTFRNVSDCTPAEFRVTEFVFNCDRLINLPVLKTHYATKVTLAMKNLKGCLKFRDKPLFHETDLSRAVVELNKIIRPTVNIIDATNWRRGGLLLASTDAVAVDAVGSALMGIDPAQVRTITLGAAAGLGEGDITRIDIIGEELKQLKFKVKLPQEKLKQSFPGLEIVGVEKACSGCLIPLLSSLSQLSEQGLTLEPLRVYLGKDPEVREDKAVLLVGDCAQLPSRGELAWVSGCAPDKTALFDILQEFISE
jgi:uncharacterized protein (DUF362 family)